MSGHNNARSRQKPVPARVSRCRLAATVVLLLLETVAWTLAARAGAAPRPMEVADMIETSRLQSGVRSFSNGHITDLGVSVSPGGTRFASLKVSGDIHNDCLTAQVITAGLQDMKSAEKVRTVATLTAKMRGHDELDLAQPLLPFFTWIDEHDVLFHWVAADKTIQIYRLDLLSGVVRQVTHHPTSVTYFAASADGTIIFTAKLPALVHGASPLLETGGIIESRDAFAMAAGDFGPTGILKQFWDRQWFIKRPGRPSELLRIDGKTIDTQQSFSISFSPDGRHAAIAAAPATIPSSWDAYTEPFIKSAVEDERRNPRRGSLGSQLHQLYLVDIRTAKARVALAAPMPLELGSNVVWAPDSKSFLVGPTFLPVPTDEQGLKGSALVEIDAETLRATRLPIKPPTAGYLGHWDELRYRSKNLVTLRDGKFSAAAARADGDWRIVPYPDEGGSRPGIRVVLEQDTNVPPVLEAIDDRSGEREVIFDPNPGLLSRFALGRAEERVWKDPAGHEWSGVLYYPVGYFPGHRYPLVIQTHGHANPHQFSLNGMGGLNPATGPGISNYVAQPLSGRGMFVLQIDDLAKADSGPAEARAVSAAYESLIDHLSGEGLIDPSRVGITGFSRTGWLVLYALTHSPFEFAAAIVSDNMDGNYLQGTLIPGMEVYELGAPPYGAGLANWLNDSPAFSAERVRTPLRVEREEAVNVPDLIDSWEMFSRLRQIGSPVEYYIVPDVLHGSHTQQNPRQILASQEAAVDWFDFWLNGRESADAAKKDQYRRWRTMRAQLAVLRSKPRPPLLEWSARPR